MLFRSLEVNDPKGDLKPGMFSRVGIVFERRAEALTIPRIALLDTDGSSNIFIVKSGKAEQRAIKTGLSNAGKVEVTEGLTGAEQVVVVGQNGLKNGNPVRVVSLEPTTKTGSYSWVSWTSRYAGASPSPWRRWRSPSLA